MTHYDRSSDRFSPLRVCGWGLTWALGTGLGVALGGYLTITSGAGATGAQTGETAAEFLTLPALAALGVFVAYVVGAVILGLVRGRLPRHPATHGDEEDHRGSDDGVERQVGREVESAQD